MGNWHNAAGFPKVVWRTEPTAYNGPQKVFYLTQLEGLRTGAVETGRVRQTGTCNWCRRPGCGLVTVGEYRTHCGLSGSSLWEETNQGFTTLIQTKKVGCRCHQTRCHQKDTKPDRPTFSFKIQAVIINSVSPETWTLNPKQSRCTSCWNSCILLPHQTRADWSLVHRYVVCMKLFPLNSLCWKQHGVGSSIM